MIKTADHAALVRLVNEGDDSVLGILADWYEDQGSIIAGGLRRIIEKGKKPCNQSKHDYRGIPRRRHFSWYCTTAHRPPESKVEANQLIELDRRLTPDDLTSMCRDYETRWEAFLDLARVYGEEQCS